MAKTTQISAADWLAVRERVTDKLKVASPRTEPTTRLKMAEELIERGYIDVEFIAAEIAEEKRIYDEAVAARQAERAARESAEKAEVQ